MQGCLEADPMFWLFGKNVREEYLKVCNSLVWG